MPTTLNNISASVAQRLDRFLDRLYRYHGRYETPPVNNALIWAVPALSTRFPWAQASEGVQLQPECYFEHYFQSQGCGPTRNECVTTSVVVSMNMIKDRIALEQGDTSKQLPDRLLEDYTAELDCAGFRGWRYRFSSHSWLPGMMSPWQAVWALRDFSALMKARYGESFSVMLSSGHVLKDLVEYLKAGNVILLHGARPMSLMADNENYNPLLPWLGGMPHTMVLVGYDGFSDRWILLNPAKPWLTKRNDSAVGKLDRWSTSDMMDFWSRKFLFYPPRFSVTVISVGA